MASPDLEAILARRRAATDQSLDEYDGAATPDTVLDRRKAFACGKKDPVQKSMDDKRALFGARSGLPQRSPPSPAAPGGGGDLASILASRRAQVPPLFSLPLFLLPLSHGRGVCACSCTWACQVDRSVVGPPEYDDGAPFVDSKGRGKVKRSDEAMQKVMEARRAHLESCEKQMKESKCVIEADQALAMGAHQVRQVEQTKRVLVQDSP